MRSRASLITLSSHVQPCMMPILDELPSITAAADTYVGVAYTTVQEIVDYVKETDEVIAGDREEGKL